MSAPGRRRPKEALSPAEDATRPAERGTRARSSPVGRRLAGRPRREGVEGPRILLAESDPYLAFLIRLGIPDAHVIEADPAQDAAELLTKRPDLLITALEGRRASELLARSDGVKVVGMIDGARASKTAVPPELDGLLLRPFLPSELYRTIGRALGRSAPETAFYPRPVRRARSLLNAARVAVVAIAALLELDFVGGSPERAALLGITFVYAALRLLYRHPGPRGVWMDVAMATVLVAGTGGLASNYVAIGLVASAEAGLVLGMRQGALAGIAILAPGILLAFAHGGMGPPEFVSWLTLFPLAAVSGGLAARIWRGDTRESSALLAEANRVLSTLHHIARAMPGGLEVTSVAAAALDEIEETLDAPAGAVLVGDAEMLKTAAAFGLPDAGAIAVQRNSPALGEILEGRDPVVERDALPAPLASRLGAHECWLAAPLRHGGVTAGLLLAACRDHSRHAANGLFLQQLARESAVAVENARLFARVKELSADEERSRLAQDLHDGLAQSLTHVRLELDFLARHAPDETAREEGARLARVVDRAIADVRSLILGLHSPAAHEGLVGSLGSYVRDVRGLGGPRIAFEASGDARLSPEVQAEIFRIAQEAISNAVRHSQASRVKVSVKGSGARVALAVEDDGVGLPAGGMAEAGMGLKTMQERARRIGSRLEVTSKPGGGTRIWLVVEEALIAGEHALEGGRAT